MSYEAKNKKQGLTKSAKIAITVTALVLLAAIIFGMVWTSLDRSYRYDREDLSVYLTEDALKDTGIPFDKLGTLPLTIPTTVTKATWLDKVKSNILSDDNAALLETDLFKKANVDISKLSYPDIVYMYYEVYEADADGKPGELLTSNNKYHDAASATTVRLGSGTLNQMIEDYMLRHPEYKTTVKRPTKEDSLAGYTLAVKLTGTYKDANDAAKTLIQLDCYNIQATPTPERSQDDTTVTYYQGATAEKLAEVATQVTNLKLGEDAAKAIVDALAKVEKLGGNAIEIPVNMKLETGAQATTTVTFKLEVLGAFLAEMRTQTFDLGNTTENPKQTPFTYKKDGATSTTNVEISKDLILNITVEYAIQLDAQLVTHLTNGKTDFAKYKPEDKAEWSQEEKDNAYCTAYIEYVKQGLIQEYVDTVKKEQETYDYLVKKAFWDEISEQYAVSLYIDLTNFPSDVKQAYVESLYYSYASQYASDSKNSTTYGSVDNYILTAIYEVENAAGLNAEKQAELLDSKLTGEVEEAIRKKVLLFYLADYCDIDITRRAMNKAEDEIYEGVYQEAVTEYKKYNSYYNLSDADIYRYAREDALAKCEAYCTPSYLREYVALAGVKDTYILSDAYPEITWTLQDAES